MQRVGLKRGNVWCVVVKTCFTSPDFIFISTIKWSGSAVPLQAKVLSLPQGATQRSRGFCAMMGPGLGVGRAGVGDALMEIFVPRRDKKIK